MYGSSTVANVLGEHSRFLKMYGANRTGQSKRNLLYAHSFTYPLSKQQGVDQGEVDVHEEVRAALLQSLRARRVVEIVLADHLVSPPGVVILPGKCGAAHPVFSNAYKCGECEYGSAWNSRIVGEGEQACLGLQPLWAGGLSK